jgi:signal transduction histidine kinase
LPTVYSNCASLSSDRHSIELPADRNRCSECRDALATAAHELKTPLAIMAGYLQLLLAQRLGPLTPKQVEVLTEMQESGVRLSNFVQNLLAYASMKVERFEMQYEMGDMNACVREIAELWSQRLHDKAIAFYFLPAENLPPFRFDWFKVQHIVSNLLDNAMKYTPARGTVWLHTEPYFWERRASQAKPLADRRHRRLCAPNCCRITVADTGPGIEPEYQQEIFEEYFRLTPAESRVEGYGLGLAIARKLVQAAGGKIWVESEPGNGSKFSFLVLLSPPQDAQRSVTQ